MDMTTHSEEISPMEMLSLVSLSFSLSSRTLSLIIAFVILFLETETYETTDGGKVS